MASFIVNRVCLGFDDSRGEPHGAALVHYQMTDHFSQQGYGQIRRELIEERIGKLHKWASGIVLPILAGRHRLAKVAVAVIGIFASDGDVAKNLQHSLLAMDSALASNGSESLISSSACFARANTKAVALALLSASALQRHLTARLWLSPSPV